MRARLTPTPIILTRLLCSIGVFGFCVYSSGCGGNGLPVVYPECHKLIDFTNYRDGEYGILEFVTGTDWALWGGTSLFAMGLDNVVRVKARLPLGDLTSLDPAVLRVRQGSVLQAVPTECELDYIYEQYFVAEALGTATVTALELGGKPVDQIQIEVVEAARLVLSLSAVGIFTTNEGDVPVDKGPVILCAILEDVDERPLSGISDEEWIFSDTSVVAPSVPLVNRRDSLEVDCIGIEALIPGQVNITVTDIDLGLSANFMLTVVE